MRNTPVLQSASNVDPRTRRLLIIAGLIFYGAVSAVLTQFYLYPEYSLSVRIFYSLTVALYSAAALLSYSLGRGEERVRVLAPFCTFTIGPFLCYPFPPARTGP